MNSGLSKTRLALNDCRRVLSEFREVMNIEDVQIIRIRWMSCLVHLRCVAYFVSEFVKTLNKGDKLKAYTITILTE
jgi:hypothetical protein